MAVRGKNRQFPTAYKLKAIRRVERGEGVLPVARELGISRKILARLDQVVEGPWARGTESQTRTQARTSQTQPPSGL
ncbi:MULTISPECIES: transposase [unclassified Bradyrhizobium]|uniref:transposase n=1 Tax=unclassified Bradyrhizobium TaxID=2631580 RepID=UPI002916D506|nr:MULTISPECIES: transposase [unclassified Bradyrhizobium]